MTVRPCSIVKHKIAEKKGSSQSHRLILAWSINYQNIFLKTTRQENELRNGTFVKDWRHKRRNQFTLSTVPAVAPEARTLSSTTQPGGSQLGLSDKADLGEASVPLEADTFLGAEESPFPGVGESGGSFLGLRGSAGNGDRRVAGHQQTAELQISKSEKLMRRSEYLFGAKEGVLAFDSHCRLKISSVSLTFLFRESKELQS